MNPQEQVWPVSLWHGGRALKREPHLISPARPLGWKTPELRARLTQCGSKTDRNTVKEKTVPFFFFYIFLFSFFLFFFKKTYLATLLHIRPPRCLSAFQQWQHCQKTQKQAVSYRCRSHGNRPAEGVPASTLICTNSARTPLPGYTLPPPSPRGRRGGGASCRSPLSAPSD